MPSYNDYRDIPSSDYHVYRDRIILDVRENAGMSEINQNALRAWIAARLAEAGRGAKARLSRHTGLDANQITRISNTELGKETRDVKAHELVKIIEFFGEAPPGYRPPETGDEVLSVAPTVSAYGALVGKVEAGSFRDVDEFDQSEQVRIPVEPDPDFPYARILIFEVVGDSMNDLAVIPILPGARVISVAYEDVADRYPLRDGMVVVVERTRDGGHLREWSIKQVELYEDRIEFHPRSKNKSHKPIVTSRNQYADDGVKVEVIALVREVNNRVTLG